VYHCATAAVTPSEFVNAQSGTYTLSKRTQPLWQAAGLASDPGRLFRYRRHRHTTAVTTGTGKMGMTRQLHGLR
jgi:hypothetical protein